MYQVSLRSEQSQTPYQPMSWRVKLRLPILFATLIILVCNAFVLMFLQPSFGFNVIWTQRNQYKISDVSEKSEALFQVGDVIEQINGQAVYPALWRPLYDHESESYNFELLRNGEQLSVEMVAMPPSIRSVSARGVTLIVSGLIWMVGTFVLLYATPDNDDAWHLGVTMMWLCVAMALSESALNNVRLTWLSYAMMPMGGAMWIETACLPKRAYGRKLRWYIRIVYGVTGLVTVIFLYDLLYLAPQWRSISSWIGMGADDLIFFVLVVCTVVHLLTIAGRYIGSTSDSVERTQLRIVLLFAMLATIPTALAVWFVPMMFVGDDAIFFFLCTFVLWSLHPIGYAYAIYRQRYLGLDFFVTQRLTWFFSGVLVLLLYIGILVGLTTVFSYEYAGGTLYHTVILVPLIALIPLINQRVESSVGYVIFGSTTQYHGLLGEFAYRVSEYPKLQTVFAVIDEACERIGIPEAVFYVLNEPEQFQATHSYGDRSAPFVIKRTWFDLFGERMERQLYEITSDTPILMSQWRYFVPLCSGDEMKGVLLLTPPIPDGHLNAEQALFLRQVADLLAVAYENVQLFEATQQMSRRMIQAEDAERTRIAHSLHSTTLHDLSNANLVLSQLIASSTTSYEVKTELENLREKLQLAGDQLRETCLDLHPRVIREGAYWLLESMTTRFVLETEMDVTLMRNIDEQSDFKLDVATAIHYIVLEALNNVQKHADATHILIHIEDNEGQVQMEISDNGTQFNLTDSTGLDMIRSGHIGLYGMSVWAETINADLTFSQSDTGGAKICLEVKSPYA